MNHSIFSKRDRYKQLSLCEDFKQVSIRTWNILRNAYEFDMSIGEETITDINLLELQMRQPSAVFTKKLTRYDESLIGADWIWAIVGRTGATIILYVQAKKFFPDTGRYNSLIERAHPFRQVDMLIRNSFFYYPLGIMMYPIYAFYNYFPEHGRQICCNCMNIMDSNLAGCSYADAIQIKNKIEAGQNSKNDLYPLQFAWSCLVCCISSANTTKETDLASSFYNRIINTQELNAFMRQQYNLNFSANNLLLGKPPELIEKVIRGEQINDQVFSDLNISEIIVFDERKMQ